MKEVPPCIIAYIRPKGATQTAHPQGGDQPGRAAAEDADLARPGVCRAAGVVAL